MLSTLHSRYFTVIVTLVFVFSIVILMITVAFVKDEISQVQNSHASDLVDTIYLNIENAYQSFRLYQSNEFNNFDKITRLKLSNYVEVVRYALVKNYNREQVLSDLYQTIEPDVNQSFWIVIHPFQDDQTLLSDDINLRNNLHTLLDENSFEKDRLIKIEFELYDLYYFYDTQMEILFCVSAYYKSKSNYSIDLLRETIKRELSISFANIRIGKSGYLFIFNDEYIFEVHPLIVGTNIRDLINPITGNRLADEFIEAAKTPQIPLEYIWNKPDDPENFTYHKKAYVHLFKPFKWYIAASFYQEDIQEPIKKIRVGIFITSFFMLILFLIPVYLITLNLTTSLRSLQNIADDIILHGQLRKEIPVSGSIETKQLGIALNDMMISIQETNDKLIHIHKMETVGSLAGGTAHDLNNMLCGISGSVFAIKMEVDKRNSAEDRDIRNLLEIIDQSVLKASDIVNKLLSLSRKTKPVMEQVDLGSLLRETIGFYKASSLSKRIRIDEDFSEGSYPIFCDRNQMEQVFLNLLINSEHAMTIMRPDNNSWGGSISIGLTSTVILDERNLYGIALGQYWQVTIEDTGIGMNEETMRQIFDPFFTTKGKKKGTGLGLSLVFNIIKLHGGAIDVFSTPGKGSLFTIRLPNAPVG